MHGGGGVTEFRKCPDWRMQGPEAVLWHRAAQIVLAEPYLQIYRFYHSQHTPTQGPPQLHSLFCEKPTVLVSLLPALLGLEVTDTWDMQGGDMHGGGRGLARTRADGLAYRPCCMLEGPTDPTDTLHFCSVN